jgi:hypothetical protein
MCDVREALAREPDGRGIDDRGHLLHVLAQQPIEKGLVAILERDQVEIAVEIAGLQTVVLVHPLELLLDGADGRRYQSLNAQCSALFAGERRPLV